MEGAPPDPSYTGERLYYPWKRYMYRPVSDYREPAPLMGSSDVLRRYAGCASSAFSPDGKIIAFVAKIDDAFAVLEAPVGGGVPRVATRIDGARIAHLCWSPSGDLFVAADRGGTERWQIYVRRPGMEGLAAFAVSEGERVQHFLGRQAVSPDGRRMVFASNAREPADVDIISAEIATGAQHPLVTGAGWYRDRGWSPDGSRVLVTRVHDNADQDLLIVDAATGQVHDIPRPAREGKMQNVPAGWLADGRIAAFTDLESEHLWLATIDPRTGERAALDRPDWSVETAMTSSDGRTVAWFVNVDGYSTVRWSRGGSRGKRETGGNAFDLTVSADGALLTYVRSASDAPSQRWIVDVNSGEARLLYQAEPGSFDYAATDPPQRARIPAADGAIPAFVFRPRGAGGRTPAVLVIHGGPEAQARGTVQPITRALLERGVSVVVPNIHGSTGYGKSWQTAIHGDFGGIDLRDLGAVAEWMATCGEFDPARLAVFGGSYGGFATLLCATRLPQYWRCAAEWFGWSDLGAAVDNAEPNWQRFMRRWYGALADDREELRRRSPITYIENVRCPLLIMQGENDPRVKKIASDQVVKQLRDLGREVEYHVFADEGHGFEKREHLDLAQQRTVDFLSQHLGVTVGAEEATGEVGRTLRG